MPALHGAQIPSASGPDAPTAQRVVDAVLAAVERLMSFHDPESELSRLNRDAWRTPQTVHPWTWAVLRRALRIAEASDGLFDITVAPLLARFGGRGFWDTDPAYLEGR